MAAGGAAAAATYALYADAQQHGMGEDTPVAAGAQFVIVWHNWHHGVQRRSFAAEADAVAAFATGRMLRRILVRLHGTGEPDSDNGWGWHLPWTELDHAGCRPDLDNELRASLLQQVMA